jgi:hypothetical protein
MQELDFQDREMGKTRKKTYKSLNALSIQEAIRIATDGRGIHSAKGDPFFVVKYGPPGSGKSSARVYQEIKKLGPPITSYVDVNQDILVESMDEYKHNHTKYNRLRYQKNKKGLSLYKKSAIVLKKAVEVRANIIIEITGGRNEDPLEWIHTLIKGTPYKLIVIMPTVPLETILKRLETRNRKRHAEEVKKEYEWSLKNFDTYIKPHQKYILVDNV